MTYGKSANIRTDMGYDNDFLSTTIRTPKLDDIDSAFLVDGSEIIGYTHFSLVLSRTRKFAIWVAWNIDGGKPKRIQRDGIGFYEDGSPRKVRLGTVYTGVTRSTGAISPEAPIWYGETGTRPKARTGNRSCSRTLPPKCMRSTMAGKAVSGETLRIPSTTR